MKLKKVIPLTLGLIVLFSVSISAVIAAEFRFATKEDQNININEGELVKNLYTAGNIVSINSKVQKDLYAAGNAITVENNVEHNFSGAGGTIVINGDVGNNVHVVAGTVIIKGNIKEDLFVAGGNILIEKSSTIEGDVVVGGGTIDIEGPIAGNVLIGGDDVVINSKISGSINITADRVKIGEFAEIEKNIKYTSPKKADINKNAKILGVVDFNQKSINDRDKFYETKMFFGILSVWFLLKIITSIVVGLVLVYFFNRIIKTIVNEGLNNSWGSLGAGFAGLFLTPIVGIILAITVIGLYLAGLIAILYILLIALSSIISNIIFGSWLIKTLKKKEDYLVGWQEVVVGVVVLKIVWFVPFIGWLPCFIFMLISMGAIIRLNYRSIGNQL